jgi:hypothetical protein
VPLVIATKGAKLKKATGDSTLFTHGLDDKPHEVHFAVGLPDGAGDTLINLLGDDHGYVGKVGRHKLLLEDYGYAGTGSVGWTVS